MADTTSKRAKNRRSTDTIEILPSLSCLTEREAIAAMEAFELMRDGEGIDARDMITMFALRMYVKMIQAERMR